MMREFTKGFLKENPILVLMLGLCPTLAVSTKAINGIGMGLAVIFVLTCSNVIISLLRSFIPDKIRIPCFIVVIATFVTIVDWAMTAYAPGLRAELGVFIPLIVVNCIILGRAEAFASKNGVLRSFLDGLGMGVAFTVTLTIIAGMREILGSGSLTFEMMGVGFSVDVPLGIEPMNVFRLAPGAFVTIGLIMALSDALRGRKK